ncbi:unnamed protein product [Sympodiomycopsis kandeliae]
MGGEDATERRLARVWASGVMLQLMMHHHSVEQSIQAAISRSESQCLDGQIFCFHEVMDLFETKASSSTAQEANFKYPPLYAFPPFFTLQPNANTLATQLSQWSNFITAWCRFHRIFLLDANITSGRELSSLWGNGEIDRRLDEQSRRKVLESMVNEGKASWEPPLPAKPKPGAASPSKALIYWRRPEEWGDRIHQWVWDTGQNGSIMTFFELTEGDAIQDQDFANLPAPMLRRALATLVKQGKAQVFEGSEGLEGVKFG